MTSALRVGVPITHRDRLPSSSRYELLVKIASGGMATVYVGRLSSVVGSSRLVAIKRAHAHLMEDPAFAKMLIEEAKLASRIHHPNVVAVQSVEEVEGELLLVMDYVEGASLADLVNYEELPMPARVAVRALLDGCAGLQAAHELTDDDGKSLGIVHRDVSPHNILVGVDGVARLTDFGIAKSSGHTGSAGQTSTGALKGKVAYMAPEYVESGKLDARSDVFSLGIVAWEALTRKRLFRGATEIESLRLVLATEVPRPSEIAPWIGRGLDDVIMKSLARAPQDRFSTAAELGEALEKAARREDLIATASQVGSFVRSSTGDVLARRRALIREPNDKDKDTTTANATYDDATRAVIAAALAADARSAGGRSEDTAPLAADGLSEVRARESVTSAIAASPSSPDVDAAASSSSVLGSTLPLGDGSRTLPLGTVSSSRMRSAVADASAAPDGSTIGGGVSAQLVEAARSGASGGRRRGRVIAMVAAAVCVFGVAVAIPVVRRAGDAPRVDEATTPPASPPITSSASAPLGPVSAHVAATPPPAASTAAASVPSASTSPASPPTPRSLIAGQAPPATKPARGVAAVPPARPLPHAKPPTGSESLPAPSASDRAPPNPYAR